jgi:hypothetical protein
MFSACSTFSLTSPYPSDRRKKWTNDKKYEKKAAVISSGD